MPLYVHNHNTSGTGVASMIVAANAGANVVSAATEAKSVQGACFSLYCGSIPEGLYGCPSQKISQTVTTQGSDIL